MGKQITLTKDWQVGLRKWALEQAHGDVEVAKRYHKWALNGDMDVVTNQELDSEQDVQAE